MCSLLVGDYCDIDFADASGMNAMNLKTKQWIDNDILLNFIDDQNLKLKLGNPVESYSIAGTLHNYFTTKYNFPKNCTVINFSGDNPCSLAGMRMKIGDIAISLGTSDTMFAPLIDPNPSNEGHVFCDPVHPSHYMALLCFKNGSLVRQHISDSVTFSTNDWLKFNHLLSLTPPGNDGNLGFYFLQTEITPKIASGFYKFNSKDDQVENFEKEGSHMYIKI